MCYSDVFFSRGGWRGLSQFYVGFISGIISQSFLRNQLAIAKRYPEEKALAGRICKDSAGFACSSLRVVAPRGSSPPLWIDMRFSGCVTLRCARQHNEEMYKKVSTNSVQQSDATSR